MSADRNPETWASLPPPMLPKSPPSPPEDWNLTGRRPPMEPGDAYLVFLLFGGCGAVAIVVAAAVGCWLTACLR